MRSRKTIFVILILVIGGIGIALLVANKNTGHMKEPGTDLKNNEGSIVYAVGSLDDQNSTEGRKNYLVYKINPRTSEVLRKNFVLSLSNDISYILSIKKYHDVLFIFADDIKNTNHWFLYAYDFRANELKELKNFQSSSPSLKQFKEQDDVVEIHDTLIVDRKFKLIFENQNKLLTEKEYGKDYGEQPNTRILRLSPERIEEIEEDSNNLTLIAESSDAFRKKVTETVSKEFEGGFRFGPSYITNNSERKSVVDYIKSVGDNRFIATIDHTQNKVIAQKPISMGNDLRLLGFQPNSSIFYAIEYKETDRSTSPYLNTYNADTLEKLHSYKLDSITFLFNISHVFSPDAKYLILNITKTRKTQEKGPNGPKSYLFIYDTEEKHAKMIEFNEYLSIEK